MNTDEKVAALQKEIEALQEGLDQTKAVVEAMREQLTPEQKKQMEAKLEATRL